MKKNLLLSLLSFACLLVGLVNGCKKDSLGSSANGAIKTSFTEEFDSVYNLAGKGWVIKDNSEYSTSWIQAGGMNKGGPITPSFPAYSYTRTIDEYINAQVSTGVSNYYSISSWLITPVLSVKNGDKISFYTRADTGSVYKDRMQVLMNNSTSENVGSNINSVGNFTTVLVDINSSHAAGGYPVTWTKYEKVFSGISGSLTTRIAFRYFVPNTASSKKIGIDLFRFESN
jgi:hypothetical protein